MRSLMGEVTGELKESLGALGTKVDALTSWKPELESRVLELQTAVGELQRTTFAQHPHVAIDIPSTSAAVPTDAGKAPPTKLGTAQLGAAPGQFGHGVATSYRGSSSGFFGSPAAPPVTGPPVNPTPSGLFFPLASPFGVQSPGNLPVTSPQAIPAMGFPRFDGENPRLWRTMCEQYFHMYSVDRSYWLSMATLNFSTSAAIWLQSVQKKLVGLDWEGFCDFLCSKFGRDQHQQLIRQFYQTKQISSVAEFVERFDALMNHLLSYSESIHPLYFLTRFVEGLREDIRAVVIIQQPVDLDAACRLALLQEEVADGLRRDRPRRFEPAAYRVPPRPGVPLPLPAPPIRGGGLAGADDRRAAEAARGRQDQDKVQALRSYRRARGLCFTCGERWGHEHKCPASVQLHVVEELLQMLHDPDSESVYEQGHAQEDQEQLAALSGQAVQGTESPKALRLSGWLGDKEVKLLIDSGSSSSFINRKLLDDSFEPKMLHRRLRVKVADGAELLCTHEVPGCVWWSQGYQFCCDLKIIPLGSYDIILGMDWLEFYSPMKVDWVKKFIQFEHQGELIQLQGITKETDKDSEPPLAPWDTAEEQWIKVCQVDCDDKVTAPEIAQSLLDKYHDVFAEPKGMPPPRSCDHQIPLLPGAQPFSIRPYRHAPALKDEIERQVKELLESGVVQPSTSPFSSPVILVKKRDQTWRLCVDYRHLNALSCKTKFPLPVIDELLDELSGAAWFSKLDLRAGYHQIRLADGEAYKTAFQTHQGHFEYKVMSFGLSGAPATFQRAMNTTLEPLLRKCALVFFDDILVYSPTLSQHLLDLESVLALLRKDQWQVKLSKCSFAQQQLSYLGHVISSRGVATEEDKVRAVRDWLTPTTAKQLRGFLGLAGYYRKFVRHFGMICRPLTSLLKKGALFIWTSECAEAFESLKQALITAPVLALPDFSKTFVIETDACDRGIGAVLQQDGHPIAFLSKALGPRASGLSAYEKECMAILEAIEHWRSYLQLGEFEIRTDQRSLVHLEAQRLTTVWQHKAFTKLMGLQYRICYKKGADNRAADALSRRAHEPGEELMAISECKPAWLEDVLAGYSNNPQAQQLLAELTVSHEQGPFSLTRGLIRYKGKIWLGGNDKLQQQVTQALHDSPIGGHSGYPVTVARIKQHFAWPRMRSTVKEYVQGCTICQQSKPDRSKYPGLLQPLETPDAAWDVATLDFIEGLPTSCKYSCILVVVDKLTRYAHFIPLAHPFTAQIVAQAYMDAVFKLHGMPLALVSDRDKIFTSQFWQHLFRMSGTQLRMSTAYHPQSDGQTERVNQCLETYLRCFTHACPRQWSKWLALAEYWYNTSTHSSLGKSPFRVLYGREPRQLGLSDLDVQPVSDVQEWLDERRVMLDLLKQHLSRAQQRMKVQADKKRSERSFQIGDSVFLKLQPYVQMSVARRSNNKLSFKFYGPYSILQRVGAVAYKLQLPPESRIHPVFHVSQLKRARPQPTKVMPKLPDVDSILQVPVMIQEFRWHKEANKMSRQGLVCWSNADESASTWENLEDLHRRFPVAPAWEPVGIMEYCWSTDKIKPRRQGRVVWNYSTPDKATWEDMEALERKYPAVAAWGQAVNQGEGIVSTTPADGKTRPKTRAPQDRRPNPRVIGPDWVGPSAAHQPGPRVGSAATT